MTIKISFLSSPLIHEYYSYKNQIEAYQTRNSLIGHWKGEYLKGNQIQDLQIEIQIDSSYIHFNKIDDLDSTYKLTIDVLTYGQLSKTDESIDFNLFVEKINSDSLIFEIWRGLDKEYKFILKRKNKS